MVASLKHLDMEITSRLKYYLLIKCGYIEKISRFSVLLDASIDIFFLKANGNFRLCPARTNDYSSLMRMDNMIV